MVFNAPVEFPVLLVGVLVLWNVVLSFVILRVWQHYNQLTTGVRKENLTQVLEQILSQMQSARQSLSELRSDTDKLREQSHKFIQKVKLLRYNPFKEVGGDQSFILALLDEDKSGIVISSLHSRESTRWFAKKVVKGKGQKHKLSEEEQKVIDG